ncbi:M6 family metalloprotease domain-containing protein [Shewanella canadensis]|uniref:M6 family metalloprotease domain-containing protein n=1 Tax=Shewanella canadensis TaxID=271096 RepID=A0A3S0KYP4_9GAMM|nr:immune inhibitor A domain-containing protein [Shewanella canadensis]RTR37315.1 M6 family metalloprotease domain-containing protein [Shewanella canadensis]
MNRKNGVNLLSTLGLSLLLAMSGVISLPVAAQDGSSAIDNPSSGTLADAGVINKEQILYWLIKRGELSAEASEAEKRSSVAAFTQRATGFQSKGGLVEAEFEKLRLKSSANAKARRSPLLGSVEVFADADITKTVKVLGVLVDFPDLPYDANRLTASDTPMFYSSYPTSHYRDLMFSTSGFTGPQGQNLMTGYQYYQAVSGDSFFFTGDVKGWVTADNNASFYGGNDVDNNDNDKAVPDLVKEAVTKVVAGMTASELASYDVEDPFDIDGDGNFDESDGDIDHVMLFHSSVGEEAGGGVLGADAIWSHRFFVYTGGNPGYTIPGTGKKVFGYTVQPIDAAAGVVVHEFGHDLGLPDEYDTTNTGDGSPVGSWSVMSGGSWTGDIPGAQPTDFSPYAKSYLQQKYKGRWITEQEILLDNIPKSGLDVQLVEAVNHAQINQISIPLPAAAIPFKQPYGGSYQYYSGQGHLINNAASFEVDLPSTTPLTLKMKAHWNIELDYDYAQVMVDGVVIAGNHTKASNTINGARNIITGTSADIGGAEGPDNWVDLEYDLSAYAGRTNAQISIIYRTDEAVGDYGLAIDNLVIMVAASQVYLDDAETPATMNLAGFSRIESERPGDSRRYIIQLRSHNGVDAGLPSHSYEPGVLLWLENFSYSDNNSSEHAGVGLIGVVDADQNLIGNNSTDIQIRDATFSMFNQSSFFGDEHLTSVSLFDDNLDYSAPLKPQAGILLPELGLTMEVVAQSTDSSTATVRLKYGEGVTPEPELLNASITAQQVAGTVSFSAAVSGGEGSYTYAWEFGVIGASSMLANPTYTYSESNDYAVSLVVTDSVGATASDQLLINVQVPPTANFSYVSDNLSITLSNASSAGVGELSYLWSFGDGQTSTSVSPSHTYANEGSYTVSLRVTDEANNVSTHSISVTVTAAVVTPPVIPSTDSGSGGGSLGWFSLALVAMLGFRRRYS